MKKIIPLQLGELKMCIQCTCVRPDLVWYFSCGRLQINQDARIGVVIVLTFSSIFFQCLAITFCKEEQGLWWFGMIPMILNIFIVSRVIKRS